MITTIIETQPKDSGGSGGVGFGFGGFPKLAVPFWVLGLGFRVPIIRTIVFWGLYWGPLILGNYHLRFRGFRRLEVRVLGFRVRV